MELSYSMRAIILTFLLVTTKTVHGQQRCSSVADVCFVIDSSGSINQVQDNYRILKSFLSRVVSFLDIGRNAVHIGAVRFSDTASLQWRLDRYSTRRELTSAISKMGYVGGYTNTQRGLDVMRRECFAEPRVSGTRTVRGDRGWAPNVAIVITDGESNVNKGQTIPMANAAKRNGIQIISVGVTDQINFNELRGMASNDRTDVFNVTEFNDLNRILDNLLISICPTIGPGRAGVGFTENSITFYEHPYYRGRSWKVTCDTPQFSHHDNIVSSMVVRGTKSWYVYEHTWYSGLTSHVTPGYYPNAIKLPGGHDRASSCRMDQPTRRDILVLYEHEHYRGRSVTVTCNSPGMGNFDNMASSVRVFGSRSFTLYEHPNYKGIRVTLIPGNYPSHVYLPCGDDKVSSVSKN